MLSKDEQLLVKAFVENQPLFDAVRKTLLQGMVGEDFTNTNWIWNIDAGLTDAAYGKRVKITKTALEWINKGFTDLKRAAAMYGQPKEEPENEAR